MGCGWHYLWLPSLDNADWLTQYTWHLIYYFTFYIWRLYSHVLMDIIYVLNDLSLGETGTALQVWGGGGTGPCQELIAVQTCKLNPRPQLGCYFYCRTHNMQNNCETKVGKTFRYRGRSKHSQQCRMYSRYIFKRSIWNSNKLMFHV